MKWLFLLAGIGANASASVLVKVAMHGDDGGAQLSLATLLRSVPIWAGLMLYGVTFVMYALALRSLPLHVAHPTLTAGAIATVALISAFVFHEQLALKTWCGIGLVLLGVILLTQGEHA